MNLTPVSILAAGCCQGSAAPSPASRALPVLTLPGSPLSRGEPVRFSRMVGSCLRHAPAVLSQSDALCPRTSRLQMGVTPSGHLISPSPCSVYRFFTFTYYGFLSFPRSFLFLFALWFSDSILSFPLSRRLGHCSFHTATRLRVVFPRLSCKQDIAPKHHPSPQPPAGFSHHTPHPTRRRWHARPRRPSSARRSGGPCWANAPVGGEGPAATNQRMK